MEQLEQLEQLEHVTIVTIVFMLCSIGEIGNRDRDLKNMCLVIKYHYDITRLEDVYWWVGQKLIFMVLCFILTEVLLFATRMAVLVILTLSS